MRSADPRAKLSKWVEVDVRALAGNLKAVKRSLGTQGKLAAVVKANAYGHGIEGIVATLAASADCDYLGVWDLAEAMTVRRVAGAAKPIMLLAPSCDDTEALVWGVRHQVIFSVDSIIAARKLAIAARKARLNARVSLDVDFGLGRWGVDAAGAVALAKGVSGMRDLRALMIATHVDYDPGSHRTEAQAKLSRFLKLSVAAQEAIGSPLLRSCANSSIFLDFPQWRLDVARLGNLLYGVNPTRTAFPVSNIWRFRARILRVRKLRKGESVGYGGEFIAPGAMRVATIGCGFADGLTMEPAHRIIRLAAGPSYWAKFRDRNLPFVGRVGIGHALLDVSRAAYLREGDIVDVPVRRTAANAAIPRIYLD
ncbi:MAG: alanine racemase [Elusimicrobiota bacterium]